MKLLSLLSCLLIASSCCHKRVVKNSQDVFGVHKAYDEFQVNAVPYGYMLSIPSDGKYEVRGYYDQNPIVSNALIKNMERSFVEKYSAPHRTVHVVWVDNPIGVWEKSVAGHDPKKVVFSINGVVFSSMDIDRFRTILRASQGMHIRIPFQYEFPLSERLEGH